MKKLYSKIKALSFSKNAFRLIMISVLFISTSYSSYGQVRVPFTPRTSNIPPPPPATTAPSIYSIKGDFTMIGNTNVTTVNPNASSNQSDVKYVDIDGSVVPGNTTFNSSSAYLDFSTENGAVPECSTIVYAGLYWTGRAFGNNQNDTNTFQVTKNGITKTLDKRKVSIKGPNSSSYTELTANASDIYYPSGTDQNMYSAYTEITDYVAQNGIGNYFVADIATREGNSDATGYYGGWGIVVVYKNSKMKWRDITIFDGHAFVTNANASYIINASGFNTVQNGDVNVKLGLMAGEGDVPWVGDFFQIERRDTNTYQTLSHSGNSALNFFNSSILTGGNARNPNLQNNTGVDIVMFDIDNTGNAIIDNSQIETSFRYGSSQDTYIIFNVTFAVDAYIPESEGLLTNTFIDGNPPGPSNISLEPDENADYTIGIKNTGTESINNTVITIPLPDSVNPTNLNINYNIYSPLTTGTNPNTPFYDSSTGSNGAIIWNLGTLPIPADPNTLLADISFTLTVTTNCSILTDPNFDPNVSLNGTISGVGAISNVSFTTDLIQGYQTDGTCIGEPIPTPSLIAIDYLDYVNVPPTASNPQPITIECIDDLPDPNINVVTDEADNSGIPPIVAFVSDVSDNNTCPEIITRTYSVTDDCDNSINVTQTITIIDTIDPTITTTASGLTVECDGNNSADLIAWLNSNGGAVASDNCSSITWSNDFTDFVSTCGAAGSGLVTFTATDACGNTSSTSATFTVEDTTPPTLIGVPDNINVDCSNIPPAPTTVTASDDCSRDTISVDFDETREDGSCDGTYTLRRTWTATDECGNEANETQIITVSATAITYTAPSDDNSQTCDYADQNALDAAFNSWVTQQTNAFAIANGCAPVLTNDSASVSIPTLCDGGSATVTWTITDLCQTITETADFNLTAPTAITYTAPSDDASNASEFDDSDPVVAQNNLDNNIAAWLTAQNATINGSVENGCNPVITNDYNNQSISFCTSDSITVNWTIKDLCQTINFSATYTFTQPDGISFTEPSSKTVNTCDFDNQDIVKAQSNLDADISAWVTDQTNIITNSITGGSPEVNHDFTNQSIDLCIGGSITINWIIDDICETINKSATYTLTAPTAITYTAPSDDVSQACDYADQNALDEAFNSWVTQQTNAFAIANGCAPVLTNDSASVSIPTLCDGGSATVTWTITDLCQTITETADFNLTAPTAITYTAPSDDVSQACEFDNNNLTNAQTQLNLDIANWVTNQTTILNNSLSNGCSASVSNNFVNQSIDFCTGGNIIITWSITDLCQTTNINATYTFTEPSQTSFDQTLPLDTTVECDALPVAEALTASNSCGNITVMFDEERTEGDCANTYTLVRTWIATNICGNSIMHKQTITVEDTTAPVLSLPVNVSAECSDDLTPISFGTATAIDNCDPNPIVTFEDVKTDGACSGTYTITRTWTATDACGNIATANQIISTSDTTAPSFDQTILPADIVIECDAVPSAVILTATDNCGNAIVTVNDERINGNCDFNYTIKRTYTATDDCGLTNTHVQTITVQDTTPPTFVETVLPVANLVVECDNIPTPETLTATDSCGIATVTVSDTRTNGSCPNSYTLARTWTATDECGLTTTYTQNIIVQDTTSPTFNQVPPRDVTVECDDVPDASTITASDNCGNAVVTINDVITNGDCPSNYFIARTWTATDECGLTTKHTQVITVQDTKAPTPTTSYDEILNVSCTDIPETIDLEFEDNCSSNISVVFNETNLFDENVLEDYQIIRTWTVNDECNNEAIYTQTLNVTLDEIYSEIVAEDRCYDEGIVNLNNLISDTLNTNGTWEVLEGNPDATLNGSIFDPTTLKLSEDFLPDSGGINYRFRYTTANDGCISVTEVIMNVHADCVVLPCGENDIVISKAITPNGDGYNDTFDIEGIDLCGFVAELKIFNRWGALVYESNNYTLGSIETSGSQGDWDGTPNTSVGNAGKLPNGTYYYIIKLRNSGLSPLTGPIYLGTK